MRKPNFFIVGAPKCGTTALYTYLHNHPEIFMSRFKEPGYFCREILYNKPLSFDEYMHLFSRVHGENAVGEASTAYLYFKPAAERIKEFLPHAKIIIMLRNPLHMIPSLHAQQIYGSLETISSLEEALRAEQERKHAAESDPRLTQLLYTHIASYPGHIARYFDLFGRENVHVIIFEEFITNTQMAYQETLQFLGVDPSFSPSFEPINESKAVRVQNLSNLMSYYQTKSKVLPAICRSIIPRRVRWWSGATIRRVVFKQEHYAPIGSQLRDDLQARFEPDIANLEELLGRNLNLWR